MQGIRATLAKTPAGKTPGGESWANGQNVIQSKQMESLQPNPQENKQKIPQPKTEKARFNPQEALKKIRDLDPVVAAGLSKEDIGSIRRGRLEKFKENLEKRREGLTLAASALREATEAEPEINRLELVAKIFPILAKHNASEEDRKNFMEIIKQYTTNDRAVRECRGKFPDNKEFYRVCFGAYPAGKIEIIRQPGGLHIVCYDEKDFSLCANLGRTRNKDGTVNIEAARSVDMEGAQGITLKYKKDVLVPELGGLITAENVFTTATSTEAGVPVRNEEAGAVVLLHEGQHRFNNLFKSIYETELNSENIKTIAEASADKAEFGNKIAEVFSLDARRIVDEPIRNEILAFLQEGSSSEEIPDLLTADGYIPDDAGILKITGFLAKKYKEARIFLAKCNETEINSKITDIEMPALKKLVLKSVVTDYPKNIDRWTDSISAMEGKGYSRDEIVAMLFTEHDPDKWPAIARRLKPKT